MVNQPIIISSTNITDYLIVILYYNSAPNAEVQRIVSAPGEANPSKNYMFVDVNPGAATVRWYASVDGDELTTLIGTFQINISKQIPTLEYRWYTVGGTQSDENDNIVDPADGASEITDIYFEGKSVIGIQIKGAGILRNEIEWDRVDNTIRLLNPENQLPTGGPVFVGGDEVAVLISYLVDVVIPSNDTAIVYNVIDEDTTLSAVHRRKWNLLLGNTTRLTITAEPLSELVDGEWYGFITNGGSQYQTLFDLDGSDTILVNGVAKGRLVFGKLQTWKIYKRGSTFDIAQGGENLLNVGQFFKSYSNSHVNALLCDGTEYDGDDYPGVWDFINSLPANFAVNSATVSTTDFGCWHYWMEGSTKKFKTPNKQNMYGRNLASFANRGVDASRTSDYPGHLQLEMIGRHRHLTVVPTTVASTQFPSQRGTIITWIRSIIMYWNKAGGGEGYHIDSSASDPTVGRTSEGHTEVDGVQVNNTENRTNNLGEFEFVRI